VSECALAASLWSSSSSSCPFLLLLLRVRICVTNLEACLAEILPHCLPHTHQEGGERCKHSKTTADARGNHRWRSISSERRRTRPSSARHFTPFFPIFFSGGFADMRALALSLPRTSLACALLFSCLRTSSSLAAYEIAIRQTYLQPRLLPKEDKGAWTVRCREEQRLSSLHSSRLPTTCQPQPLFSLFAFVKHALSLHIIKTNRA